MGFSNVIGFGNSLNLVTQRQNVCMYRLSHSTLTVISPKMSNSYPCIWIPFKLGISFYNPAFPMTSFISFLLHKKQNMHVYDVNVMLACILMM